MCDARAQKFILYYWQDFVDLSSVQCAFLILSVFDNSVDIIKDQQWSYLHLCWMKLNGFYKNKNRRLFFFKQNMHFLFNSRPVMNSISSQHCRPISTQSITSTDSADSEENYVAMVCLTPYNGLNAFCL